jgi:hypothetical protein
MVIERHNRGRFIGLSFDANKPAKPEKAHKPTLTTNLPATPGPVNLRQPHTEHQGEYHAKAKEVPGLTGSRRACMYIISDNHVMLHVDREEIALCRRQS